MTSPSLQKLKGSGEVDHVKCNGIGKGIGDGTKRRGSLDLTAISGGREAAVSISGEDGFSTSSSSLVVLPRQRRYSQQHQP